MASKSHNRGGLSSHPVQKPEHSILWLSRRKSVGSGMPTMLKGFFTCYARKHMRALPWRQKGVTPFRLLLAEVLLVQTKADDVARIWPELVKKYAGPEELARAKKASLVKLLKTLGLQNQRAYALKNISKTLVARFGGRVPGSVDRLLSIPYIGLYTATAIACFHFGERLPIVDANVLRVLGRISDNLAVKDLRRSPDIWASAWAILPRANCRLHNYGILDFASSICRVREPQCSTCPLNKVCIYGRERLSSDLQTSIDGKKV
jgi:A/G-specific adenine glycosylase